MTLDGFRRASWQQGQNASSVYRIRSEQRFKRIVAVSKGVPNLNIYIFLRLSTVWHELWRHRYQAAPLPVKYSLSCREDQSLSDESKTFSKYWYTLTYQKYIGGVRSTPPPHHPPCTTVGYDCTTVGVWLCVYVRGLRGSQMLYL